MTPHKSNFVCVDMGGTFIRLARATSLDHPLFVGEIIRRRVTHDFETDLKFLIESAQEKMGDAPLVGLGIGMPGRINAGKTQMVGSNNLPEWVNRNFVGELSSALNCNVYMDNDGIAAGLGEGYFNDRSGKFDFLIWGTGISSIRVEHRPGNEFATTYLRREYHELFEDWENNCGGVGIQRKFGQSGENLAESQRTEIWANFQSYLHQYLSLAKPKSIVIGGGLAEVFSEYLATYVSGSNIKFRHSEFGENYGLVGALALIRRGKVSAKLHAARRTGQQPRQSPRDLV